MAESEILDQVDEQGNVIRKAPRSVFHSDSLKIHAVVSLFSGAGGMNMGFELEGFKTIWTNDIDKNSCLTHKNWSDAEVVQGDIEKLRFNQIPKRKSNNTSIQKPYEGNKKNES